MTRTKALNLIYKHLIEPADMLDSFLHGKGLNIAVLEDIKDALRFLVVDFYGKEEVPKKLAYAITNASGYFLNPEFQYTDDERQIIYQTWKDVEEIAIELFKG